MKQYSNTFKTGKTATFFSMTALACLLISGCAGAWKAQYAPQNGAVHSQEAGNDDDPLEGYNRFMFKVNDAIDRAVIEPVTRGYHDYVPHPIRAGLRNFLHNLRGPVNAGNNLLQGNVEDTATDVMRFAINTTFGIGGLIDVAEDAGLKYRSEDFGQTLGVWGIGSGPYLVLPLLGPSSIRDTAGLVVDGYADPINRYLFNTHNEGWYYARVVATGLDKREELLGALDDLRRHSFDYYAATRSAYTQEREAMIRNQKPGQAAASAPAIPDYDEPRGKKR